MVVLLVNLSIAYEDDLAKIFPIFVAKHNSTRLLLRQLLISFVCTASVTKFGMLKPEMHAY